MSDAVPFMYPALGWYFSPHELEGSFVFKNRKWVCMFMYWKLVSKKGRRIRFSGDNEAACVGPAEYCGFRELEDDEGRFIADVEHFKKTRHLAREYRKESLQSIHPPQEKYLYLEKIETINENEEIEVVNLFPEPAGLASLTVLSNYDREQNMDNVATPFASGCQSVFTIPYNEKFQGKPMGVIGLMDPLVRNFVPDDMLAFSLPANRFVEMADNIQGSFLDKNINSHPS